MALSPLNKQTAGYKLPHDWLVRLTMNLAVLCVICGAENSTNLWAYIHAHRGSNLCCSWVVQQNK